MSSKRRFKERPTPTVQKFPLVFSDELADQLRECFGVNLENCEGGNIGQTQIGDELLEIIQCLKAVFPEVSGYELAFAISDYFKHSEGENKYLLTSLLQALQDDECAELVAAIQALIDTDTIEPDTNVSLEITDPVDGNGFIVITVTSGDGTTYPLTFPEPTVDTVDPDTDTRTANYRFVDGDMVYDVIDVETGDVISTETSPLPALSSALVGVAGGTYVHTANGPPTTIEALDNGDSTISTLGLKASSQILSFDCTPEGLLEIVATDANTGVATPYTFKSQQENAAKEDFTANLILDQAAAQAIVDADGRVLLGSVDVEVLCPGERLHGQLSMQIRGAAAAIDPDKLDAQVQVNIGFSTDPTLASGNRSLAGPLVLDYHGETVHEEPQKTPLHQLPNLPVGTHTLYIWMAVENITRWVQGSIDVNQTSFVVKRGTIRCCD